MTFRHAASFRCRCEGVPGPQHKVDDATRQTPEKILEKLRRQLRRDSMAVEGWCSATPLRASASAENIIFLHTISLNTDSHMRILIKQVFFRNNMNHNTARWCSWLSRSPHISDIAKGPEFEPRLSQVVYLFASGPSWCFLVIILLLSFCT